MTKRSNNILVIQARTNPSVLKEEQEIMNQIAQMAGVTFAYANPLDMNSLTPWKNPKQLINQFGGTIWLGTSDMDHSLPTELNKLFLNRTMPLASRIIENDEPALGICFGHQTLALAAGGIVERSLNQAETGTTIVHIKQQDPLFNELPEKGFKMVFGHKDSVTKLPKGAIVIGETLRDPHSALRIGKRITTFQGHPEIMDISRLQRAVEVSKTSTLGHYATTYSLEKPDNTGIIITNFAKSVVNNDI